MDRISCNKLLCVCSNGIFIKIYAIFFWMSCVTMGTRSCFMLIFISMLTFVCLLFFIDFCVPKIVDHFNISYLIWVAERFLFCLSFDQLHWKIVTGGKKTDINLLVQWNPKLKSKPSVSFSLRYQRHDEKNTERNCSCLSFSTSAILLGQKQVKGKKNIEKNWMNLSEFWHINW